MQSNIIVNSWNPNKYAQLRDIPLKKIGVLVLIAAVASIALFLILLIPTLLQGEAAFAELAAKTEITLDGTFAQRESVYLLTNPDVLVTSGEENGFIRITPEGFSIRYFIFFGERTYPWILFADFDTIPLQRIALGFALFALPSALVWGTLLIIVNLALFGLLYTLIAYFVLHARKRHVLYEDLWKVTLVAGVPSMAIFAVTPILRLGLPVAIIIGFYFVVWLVFSLLGSTIVAHHEPKSKFVQRK